MIRLLFLLLFFALRAQAQPDSLLQPGPEQLQRLQRWYNDSVRKRPATEALAALSALQQKAAARRDNLAACAALYYEGQYRAVILQDAARGVARMQAAIAEAHSGGRPMQEGLYRHHLGYYFTFSDNYSQALLQLLQAEELFDRIGQDQVGGAASNQYRLAFVYYHLEDYEQALAYCSKGLRLKEEDPLYTLYLANTAGQCAQKLMRYPDALRYYKQTLEQARRLGNDDWSGIALGNIGRMYLGRNEFREARPYLEQYLAYTDQTRDWGCRAEALTSLARVELEAGNGGKAQRLLAGARHLFDSARSVKPLPAEQYARLDFFYETSARSAAGSGRSGEAYAYSLLRHAVRDSLDRRSLLSGAGTVRQQVLAEKMRSEQRLLAQERKTERLRRWFLAAALVLVLMIAGLLYNRARLQLRRNRERHRLREERLLADNERIRAELEASEQALTDFRDNLRQKTNTLFELEQQLAALRNSGGSITDAQIDVLTELTRATILTPQEWTAFRNLFEKVHPDFFRKLRERYPSLSPAETRLLTLTKLGMSTSEMATTLGVSPESVKKTRQRLRRELELPQAANIEDLVADL
ncbi:tetratricopeptide repeat protein [Flaviaesturariibacter amylovorans]|uniref:HTH luxR-type domain-containing protein n=1 Tax=Flaviaesturariibacter amylovorans TaxID=1084520 RepID=A0ABP8H0T2_9BACT